MAHVLAARVAETSTSTGTGAFTLSAALTAHRRFSAVCTVGDTVEYMIVADDGTWEEGIGTYSSANTLTRTTVTSSSTGSAITFAAGNKTVLMTPLARRVLGTLGSKVVVSGTAIDLALGTHFTKTISGATTFTVSNVPASGLVSSFVLDLTNGGSATVVWWSGVKWVGGVAPALTVSGRDALGFFTHDGGTTWTGVVAKDVK